MSENVDKLASLIQQSQRIVVFSGAGISTESGIPDFRGPGGVWEKYDPNEFHIDRFLASEESRRRYWQRTTEFYAEIAIAQPNAAHRAVVDLEELGKLSAVITQNVDGLHQIAGTSPERVIELHGTSRFVACMSCGDRHPRESFQERVSAEGDAPDCEQCGGLMKPATVSFGQQLPQQVLERASQETVACDLFLVVGSSLVVYPAAGFPLMAVQKGTPLAIINHQETPHDQYAAVVVQESAGEVLPAITAGLGAQRAAAPTPLPF
ncbi:MAG: Sir2 family NAD-dependent protein deacetylase [SAR324 cluster bacterium]|nr:Sir2 family NAD-dependent protein deacetylase [SAR324 cluster bacterium]